MQIWVGIREIYAILQVFVDKIVRFMYNSCCVSERAHLKQSTAGDVLRDITAVE